MKLAARLNVDNKEYMQQRPKVHSEVYRKLDMLNSLEGVWKYIEPGQPRTRWLDFVVYNMVILFFPHLKVLVQMWLRFNYILI